MTLIHIPMNIPMKPLATPNKTEQGLSVVESFKIQSLIYLAFIDVWKSLKATLCC